MFADILDAAEAGDFPSVVLRSALLREVRAVPPEGISAPDDRADAGALAAEWSARNELLAREGAAVPVAPDAVHFVNYAALRTYADCPMRYQYRYIHRVSDGLAGGDTGDDIVTGEAREEIEHVRLPKGVTPAAYGIFVHELLRELLATKGTSPPQGWIEAAANRQGVPARRVDEVAGNAARLVDAFLSSEIATPGGDIRLEEPFQVRLDRAVYHGVFDRVERAPGGWVVTDYKIGREREDYEFQVSFYAWAAGKITGAGDVAGRLCFLRENEAVVRAAGGRQSEIESLAENLEKSLVCGSFDASPADRCATCPYAITCPDSDVA